MDSVNIKFDSIIAGPINYVFNSEELEMEFDSELKIIFPTMQCIV